MGKATCEEIKILPTF